MDQFSLDKWLKDKSRKVVTRLKKSVQIISIEGKEDIPIVALVEGVAHQLIPTRLRSIGRIAQVTFKQ